MHETSTLRFRLAAFLRLGSFYSLDKSCKGSISAAIPFSIGSIDNFNLCKEVEVLNMCISNEKKVNRLKYRSTFCEIYYNCHS